MALTMRSSAERSGVRAGVDDETRLAMVTTRVSGPYAETIARVFDGLGHQGELVTVVEGNDPIAIRPIRLLIGRRSIRG